MTTARNDFLGLELPGLHLIDSSWNLSVNQFMSEPEQILRHSLIFYWSCYHDYCCCYWQLDCEKTTTLLFMLLDFSFRSTTTLLLLFFVISITFAGDYPTAAFHFRASLPITPPPSSSSVMEEEKKRSWFRPRSQIRKSPVIDFAVLLFRLQIYK